MCMYMLNEDNVQVLKPRHVVLGVELQFDVKHSELVLFPQQRTTYSHASARAQAVHGISTWSF